jgi:hypothetical protein
MLTILLSLLSSSGFGSIVGLVGGMINRKFDLQDKNAERTFELAKMDKEAIQMEAEWKHKTVVAGIEADAVIESSAYKAMEKSYDFAVTTSEDGIVDKISKMIRPLITICFFFFTIYVFYKINSMMVELKVTPDPEDVISIWKSSIEWILFQAGVSIGWWFAMRPGKSPTFIGK